MGSRGDLSVSSEACAQRRGDARQIERGARALPLAAAGAEPGLAGGHVVGAARLVVQRARVAQVLHGGTGPIECQQRVADVLLAVGDGEVAVQRRVDAARLLQPLQRLVLAAHARQHDPEAVVADRDVARALAPYQRAARALQPLERRSQLPGLGERDPDLSITGCGGTDVTARQVPGGRVRARRCCGGLRP